jgi:hypothetical protein
MSRVGWALVVLLLVVPPVSAQDYFRGTVVAAGGATLTTNVFTGVQEIDRDGIVVTSTDGLVLANNTAATAGVPVQQSPRLRFRANSWDSDDLVSRTNDFWFENVPMTSTATQGILMLKNSVNGAAATMPAQFGGAGSLTLLAYIEAGATNYMAFTGRTVWQAPANGHLTISNNALTTGSLVKVDALPTVSACGAGSPAVVAGSTPFSGAVTIGTTAVATCTITFNGTAFPSAPRCGGNVETTTAANVRAMGYSATTTVLTIVPASAWVDGSVVNWDCVSAK